MLHVPKLDSDLLHIHDSDESTEGGPGGGLVFWLILGPILFGILMVVLYFLLVG